MDPIGCGLSDATAACSRAQRHMPARVPLAGQIRGDLTVVRSPSAFSLPFPATHAFSRTPFPFSITRRKVVFKERIGQAMAVWKATFEKATFMDLRS
jgi:hypothetical protein